MRNPSGSAGRCPVSLFYTSLPAALPRALVICSSSCTRSVLTLAKFRSLFVFVFLFVFWPRSDPAAAAGHLVDVQLLELEARERRRRRPARAGSTWSTSCCSCRIPPAPQPRTRCATWSTSSCSSSRRASAAGAPSKTHQTGRYDARTPGGPVARLGAVRGPCAVLGGPWAPPGGRSQGGGHHPAAAEAPPRLRASLDPPFLMQPPGTPGNRPGAAFRRFAGRVT